RNAERLYGRMAEWLAARVAVAKDRFAIALSGGHTPRGLYAQFAGRDVPWQRVECFWGDERFVPHASPDSNYRMAKLALLDHVPIPYAHIHPIPVAGSAADAARDYESVLQRRYGGTQLGGRALFDVMLMGLGADGHT